MIKDTRVDINEMFVPVNPKNKKGKKKKNEKPLSFNINPEIIVTICSYFPDSKNYLIAKEIKNKYVSTALFDFSYRQNAYLFLLKENLRIQKLPSGKVIDKRLPVINFEKFTNESLKNYLFFYNPNDKDFHAFKLNPFEYRLLKVNETIEEIIFYYISDEVFLALVNHKTVYKFKNLKLIENIPLTDGFFFEEVYIDEMIYSDFFGDFFVVQSLKMEMNDQNKPTYPFYKLKFEQSTHYTVIGKDMVVIDFAVEKTLKNVLPPNNKQKDDLKNILCKFNLVPVDRISLEFVDFLPYELKIESFDIERYLYYSMHLEEKFITLWQKNKQLGRVDLTHEDKVVEIKKLNKNNLVIGYSACILAIVDFMTCNVKNIIDLKLNLQDIKYHCCLQPIGNYFVADAIGESEDEVGSWKNYILDTNFEQVYELDDDDFILVSE